MKAIILGAGFSTRLYPLTKHFPKALLEVGGKPIVEYLLDELLQIPDIDEIAFLTNHHYLHHFETWLGKYKGRNIRFIDNQTNSVEERRGAIRDIIYVLENTSWHDDMFIAASDTLTSLNLQAMINFFYETHGVVNALYDL